MVISPLIIIKHPEVLVVFYIVSGVIFGAQVVIFFLRASHARYFLSVTDIHTHTYIHTRLTPLKGPT